MDAGAGIHAHPPRRRVGWASAAAILAAAVVVGGGVGAVLHLALARSASPRSALAGSAVHAAAANGLHGQATWRAGVEPAPAITTLRDQTGHPFSLASLRGRTVAMTFFDSHCNQACPLEGRALAASERSLAMAQRPVLVAVSVNPRDTSASVWAAARKWGLASVGGWHWLMGSNAQLARVWKAYHIFVAPPRNGDISHTEALYLIDRRGYERSGYLYPFVSRYVTLDLRTLASGRMS